MATSAAASPSSKLSAPLSYPPLFDHHHHPSSDGHAVDRLTTTAGHANGSLRLDGPSQYQSASSGGGSDHSYSFGSGYSDIRYTGDGVAARPPTDVNLGFVIENPREQITLLDEILERNTRLVPVPPELPPLPEITRRDFAGYVSQLRVARVRGGLTAEEMSTDFLDESAASSAHGGSGSSRNAHGGSPLKGGSRPTDPVSAAAAAAAATAAALAQLGENAAAIVAKEGAITSIDGAGYIDAFRAVPTEFFAPSFDIRQPDNFDRLLELAEEAANAASPSAGGGARPAAGDAAPVSNRSALSAAGVGALRGHQQQLSSNSSSSSSKRPSAAPELDGVQEALTTYLDIVEWQLLALIKARSRQFFGALQDLQELQTRITNANRVATALQRRIAAIKHEGAVQPLYVVHAARRRARGAELKELLTVLRDSELATGSVGKLVSGGDLMSALDLIQSTRTTLAGRLARVTAAGGLRRRLDEYERLVGDTLVSSWTSTAVSLAIAGPPPAVTSGGEGDLYPSSGAGVGTPSGGGPSGAFMTPSKGGPTFSFDAFLAGAVIPAAKAAPRTPGTAVPNGDSSAEAAAAAVADAQQAASAEAALEALLGGSVKVTLEGLIRTGRLSDALEAFQSSFSRELKALMRSEVAEALASAETASGIIPSSSPTTDGGAATDASAERVAALPPAGFLRVLTSVCTSLENVLNRTYALHETVERVLDTFRSRPGTTPAGTASIGGSSGPDAASSSSSSSNQFARVDPSWAAEVGRLRALSSGVLAVAVDATQRHVGRLLALRRSAAPHLRVADMRQQWEVGAAYASAFSSLLAHAGGGGGGSGKDLLPHNSSFHHGATSAQSPILEECLAHARGLLAHSHAKNVAALSAMLDGEQWRQADVPSQVQALADAMAASGTSYGASVVQAAAAAAEGVSRLTHTNEDPSAQLAEGVSRTLAVKGTRYALVGTGVMLVKMLGDYSSLAEAIPDVSPEVIRAVVELLRSFNARSTDLVLGAKAMQTAAALKRITAKHLALTSQTLGAVLSLLPSIRASLIMRLPPSQHVLLAELARVTADYMAHEQAILAKFVAIVKDLLVKCVGDMRALPWGNPSQPLTVPTAPMRDLTKGISTLHRILLPVLRPEQLLDVFGRITVMVGAQVPVQYTALLAHLTDASVAAIAAYHEAVAAARASEREGSGLASPNPATASALTSAPPKFSREVANERLAADVRVLTGMVQNLLTSCRELIRQPASAATSPSEDNTSATVVYSILTEAEAGLASGEAALHSLGTWVERQFGAASIVLSPTASGAPFSPVPAVPASSSAAVESEVASASSSVSAYNNNDSDRNAQQSAPVTPKRSATGATYDRNVAAEGGYSSHHHLPSGSKLPLLRMATAGNDLILAAAAAAAAAEAASADEANAAATADSSDAVTPPAAGSSSVASESSPPTTSSRNNAAVAASSPGDGDYNEPVADVTDETTLFSSPQPARFGGGEHSLAVEAAAAAASEEGSHASGASGGDLLPASLPPAHGSADSADGSGGDLGH